MKVLRVVALVLLLVFAVSAAFSAVMKPANIVVTAGKNSNLSTFVKAVKAAGLTSDLEKPGPFTVFAPDNAAFAKVPKATMDSLMKPANKAKLRDLLLSHVIKGKMSSAEIMKMKSPGMVATLQGMKIKITHSKAGVMVGKAKVVKSDIMASNGVIHVIDTVMMPMAKQKAMPKNPSAITKEKKK
jgi:uncharacterized surface protein with fasciclin (FAS1) repeats